MLGAGLWVRSVQRLDRKGPRVHRKPGLPCKSRSRTYEEEESGGKEHQAIPGTMKLTSYRKVEIDAPGLKAVEIEPGCAVGRHRAWRRSPKPAEACLFPWGFFRVLQGDDEEDASLPTPPHPTPDLGVRRRRRRSLPGSCERLSQRCSRRGTAVASFRWAMMDGEGGVGPGGGGRQEDAPAGRADRGQERQAARPFWSHLLLEG